MLRQDKDIRRQRSVRNGARDGLSINSYNNVVKKVIVATMMKDGCRKNSKSCNLYPLTQRCSSLSHIAEGLP
jgi:hypothetical protein